MDFITKKFTDQPEIVEKKPDIQDDLTFVKPIMIKPYDINNDDDMESIKEDDLTDDITDNIIKMEHALLSTNIMMENTAIKIKARQYKILTESNNPEMDQIKLGSKSPIIIEKFVKMTKNAVNVCMIAFQNISTRCIHFFHQMGKFITDNENIFIKYINDGKWIKCKDFQNSNKVFTEFMNKLSNIHDIIQVIYDSCGFVNNTTEYKKIADEFEKSNYMDDDLLYKAIFNKFTSIETTKKSHREILDDLSCQYISTDEESMIDMDDKVVDNAINILISAEDDIIKLLTIFNISGNNVLLKEIADIANDIQKVSHPSPDVCRYYRYKYKILSTAKLVLIDMFNIGYKSLLGICNSAHYSLDLIIKYYQ